MASEQPNFSARELEGTFALLFLVLLIGFAIKEFVRMFRNMRAQGLAVRIFDLAFMPRDDPIIEAALRRVEHPDIQILEEQEWVRRRNRN